MNLPEKPVPDRRDPVEGAEKKDVVPRLETITDAPIAPRVRPIPLWRWIIAGALQTILPILVISAGVIVYQAIVASAPVAERKARERVPRLVEVATVETATQGPQIRAWGEVTAAQTLIVRPEIAGTLAWVSPDLVAGGYLKAGDVAARLDDRDLELAVLRAEADIAEIDARIQIEKGQAEIGKRELTRLSRNLTEEQKALVLREPQMAQLEAERAAAVAALEQARNALERSAVMVPFDALVISEDVAPGAMLAQGTQVAELVAADQFNITASVPATALDWIDIEHGAEVAVRQPGVWPEGTARTGTLLRLASDVSETGRMAELIVKVPDPHAREAGNTGLPRLLLGSFVEVTLTGRPVTDAVVLDRANLRDGDTVWVMTPDDKLEVRSVEIAWRDSEVVLVTDGLSDGERVITTPLASFTPGMALRTRDGVQG